MSVPHTQQNDHSPDTTGLYVWLSRDADGQEGIIAMPSGDGGAIPLVLASKERALRMRPMAELAARARQMDAHLVHFERREIVDTVHVNER